jgi:hypothetical protein
MTGETPPLSRDTTEGGWATRPPGNTGNPYFRTLALLATFLLALGVVLMINGEVSTGGILLGVGFSALIAVLVTGAITWQIRQTSRADD